MVNAKYYSKANNKQIYDTRLNQDELWEEYKLAEAV